MPRFYRFTPELAKFLRDNLSHSEWKLWSYLATLDPFGQQYIEAPPTLTTLSECNISKATYYRSIAKFQELELFDFQDKGFNFRNLRGLTGENGKNEKVSRMRQESHECDKNLTDEKNSLTDENLSIYKEVQTLSDCPDGKSEFSGFSENTEDSQPPIASCVVTEVSQALPPNPIDSGEDKFSEARTTIVQGKNVRQRNFNWLPEGPWNIEGKLDPNFRDFVANDWLKRFGGDIHAQRANVLSHFKKDPANLPIRWEQYQGEYLDRVQNTQILLNNGVEIKPEYQDRLINNQRALTQSLPQELNPCAQRALGIASLPSATIEPLPITRGIVEGVESVTAIAPVVTPVDLVKNEDGQVFKVFKAPKPVDEPITPQQWEEVRKKLAAFTGNFNFGKSPKRENSPSKKGVTEDTQQAIALEVEARKRRNLEELNQWIVDPILRSEAMKKVMLSDCYKCLFTEEGTPYQVIYCEEF